MEECNYGAKWIREFAPGYLGGEKVARHATDEEIVEMARLNDLSAKASNDANDYKRMFNNIVAAVESRA